MLNDTDLILSDIEIAAINAFPDLRRLIELRRGGGWIFQPVKFGNGVVMLGGTRVWLLGWTEAIMIRNVDDVKAFRCDPEGGEVWGDEGGLVDVIDGLLALPEPGSPNAPVLVKGRRPKLWTPGEVRP